MADTGLIERRGPRPPDRMKSVWAVTALVLVTLAVLDPQQLRPTLEFVLSALGRTAPYIVFAVILIAGLKATGSETLVSRAFEEREVQAIFMAAVFGGLAPFCSCQVIPFIAALIVAGAPLSAIMAFWLASPLIDPPTLLITAAALGWPFAIAKAVAAIGVGLMGGFVVRALTRAGHLTNVARQKKSCGTCCSSAPKTEARPVWRFWQEADRRATFRGELLDNGMFLLKWLALAYVLESLLITYIPAEAVAGVVGGEGLLPIVISAFVGMPAYLNSYVAPPLLAGLTEQGMTAGAAMAFMVAGAISSVPAMAAVWALVVRRVFALYLALGLGGAVLSGVLFQLVA
ncbi:MAG: permease [Salibaculum sp.]|uniref:permease n=1 Tax=Salibaculum sp. TaxID=2855480 RepID=UPI0028700C28|nr:permease [Salibaculum sp.]MDR9428294.1 permease [Salibaculum sp.]MDR9482643.1 permease [Salibaculum sp.]